MLPSFLVIGGQRCATTWLYTVLRRHPQVFCTDPKEPDYFNHRILRLGLADYQRLFAPAEETGLTVRGCMSVNYSTLDGSIVRHLARLLPGVRLVYTIRHPVHRAWSQAKLVFGILRRHTFHRTPTAKFLRFFEGRRCAARNDYGWALDNWTGAFGRESVHLDLYDRVCHDPRGYLAGVLRHIGADPSHADRCDLPQGVHASQDLDMPDLVRWYLSTRWLEPTRRLNDRLGGAISHWVEDMHAHSAPRRAHWRLYRALNRTVLTFPERFAYAAYQAHRTRQLDRRYREIFENLEAHRAQELPRGLTRPSHDPWGAFAADSTASPRGDPARTSPVPAAVSGA